MVLVYLPRKLGDFGQGQMLMCIFQHHGMGSIFYCVLVKNMLKQQISTSNLHPIFGMEKKNISMTMWGPLIINWFIDPLTIDIIYLQ